MSHLPSIQDEVKYNLPPAVKGGCPTRGTIISLALKGSGNLAAVREYNCYGKPHKGDCQKYGCKFGNPCRKAGS